MELTVRVEVPEPPTIEVGLRAAVSPADAVSVRATVPVKPLTAATVTVAVVDEPAFTLRLVGLTLIVKSWKVKVATAVWVRVPSVPDIVTVYVAAVVELHARLAVPEPVTLAGVIGPHVRPAGTVSVRPTVPLNPLRKVIVIVEVAEDPAFAVGELAAIVKSTKLKVAVVVCARVPLVPVIESTYVPAVVVEQGTVAVPDPVTEEGVIVPQVSPAGTNSVRDTVPLNPLTAVTVIIEVATWPLSTAAGELAVRVKSVKLNVAVAVWVREPLVPVNVRR